MKEKEILFFNEYLNLNMFRSMSTLPMTLSLVASFMSAITLLGVPAEIYTAGTQFAMSAIRLRKLPHN